MQELGYLYRNWYILAGTGSPQREVWYARSSWGIPVTRRSDIYAATGRSPWGAGIFICGVPLKNVIRPVLEVGYL